MQVRRVLALLVLGALPLGAFCQGVEAKAAMEALSKKTSDARFAALVIETASSLASFEDAIWLVGGLAFQAKLPDQRKALLVENASMLELTGDYGEAASAWEAAARAMPGVADAVALLSAAACRLVSGDAEAAYGLATALSFSSPDQATASLAKIITGWAALARGDSVTALATARTMTADTDPRVAVAALLLARAASESSARDEYDLILSRRFPSRPEAGSAGTLSLFLAAGSTVSPESAATAPAGPELDQPPDGTTYFQVGAFRDESNARAMAARLAALGLAAHTGRRAPKDMYVVYVEAGQDAQATVMKLKDAGYESWMMDSPP